MPNAFQTETLRSLQAWAEHGHEETWRPGIQLLADLADGGNKETDEAHQKDAMARSEAHRQWLIQHGLMSVLATLLSQGDLLTDGPGAAANKLAGWGKIRQGYICRSLQLEAAARAVTTALNAWGGSWAFMKGFALARSVYDHPYMRTSADIDILVSTEDRAEALSLLYAIGGTAGSLSTQPHEQSICLKGVHLDLHNVPMRRGRLRFNPAAEWLSRTRKIGPFPCLAEHDELVLGLIHPAVTEYLGRTVRMLDLLLQVRRGCQAINWEGVADDVARLGLANAAYVTAIRLDDLFPSRTNPVIPASFLNSLRIGGLRRRYWGFWLARRPDRLYATRPDLARLLFSIWLNDTPGDWTRDLLDKQAAVQDSRL